MPVSRASCTPDLALATRQALTRAGCRLRQYREPGGGWLIQFPADRPDCAWRHRTTADLEELEALLHLGHRPA